jgi:hypothetical protein
MAEKMSGLTGKNTKKNGLQGLTLSNVMVHGERGIEAVLHVLNMSEAEYAEYLWTWGQEKNDIM